MFSTPESFGASDCGLNWVNGLLEEFGSGHWTLTIDADELFIYPHFEHMKLPDVCRFLDSMGAQSVFALLLDMYSDKPVIDTRHEPGRSLIDTCRYFDAEPYVPKKANSFPYLQIYGGVRARLLLESNITDIPPPTISKVPLVKWQPGLKYTLATHAMTAVPISNLGTALLHFKFLDDFPNRVHTEAAREEHFANGREYKTYDRMMVRNPGLCLKTPQSIRFESSAQLVQLKLMKSSAGYEEFVRNLS